MAENKYPWLTRALDPSSPTYKDSYDDEPETVQTSSVYRDNLGGEILFPTIRLVNGVLKKYSIDDAVEIALQKKDYILVKGEKQQAQDKATQLSKTISEMIANARREFAKGGTTVARKQFDDTVTPDEQMDILGLVEEQEDIDPVSGNEIPLGATAEGVRDDQTAAISPGEFVVPDHAVRYHGLDFYMKTIRVAEAGLNKMEKMGMTGTPDKATIPDDAALPTMRDDSDQLQRLIAAEKVPEAVANKGAAILPAPILNFAHGGWHPPTPVNEQTGGTYNIPLATPQQGQGPWGRQWQGPWGRQWQGPWGQQWQGPWGQQGQGPWGQQWQGPWGNTQPSPWGPPTTQQWQPPQSIPPPYVPPGPLPIMRPEISPTAEAEPRHIGQTPYEDFDAPQKIEMYQNAEGDILQIPETFYGKPMQPVPEGYSRMDPDASAPPPPPTPVPPSGPTPEELEEAAALAQDIANEDQLREDEDIINAKEDRKNELYDSYNNLRTDPASEMTIWIDGEKVTGTPAHIAASYKPTDDQKIDGRSALNKYENRGTRSSYSVDPPFGNLIAGGLQKLGLMVQGAIEHSGAANRIDAMLESIVPGSTGDPSDEQGKIARREELAAAAAARVAAAQPWRKPEELLDESEDDPLVVEREPVALDESEDDPFVVEEPQSVKEPEPPRDQTPYDMDEGEGDMNKGGIIQKPKQSRNHKRKNGKGLAKRK